MQKNTNKNIEKNENDETIVYVLDDNPPAILDDSELEDLIYEDKVEKG